MLKRFVKRLLSCLLLAALFVLVVIGGTLGVQGWRLYRATAAQKPLPASTMRSAPGPALPAVTSCPRPISTRSFPWRTAGLKGTTASTRQPLSAALGRPAAPALWAEGGSTLTQQLAKNELFTQEKQLARKAAEMFAARDIEDTTPNSRSLRCTQAAATSATSVRRGAGCAGLLWQTHPGADPRRVCGAGRLPNAPSVYAANGELARRRALVVVERMERAKKLTHTQALELRDEVSALPLW